MNIYLQLYKLKDTEEYYISIRENSGTGRIMGQLFLGRIDSREAVNMLERIEKEIKDYFQQNYADRYPN